MAYVEFAHKDAVNTTIALDDSIFRGGQIKITTKRTNQMGVSSTNRPPRVEGFIERGGEATFLDVLGEDSVWMESTQQWPLITGRLR